MREDYDATAGVRGYKAMDRVACTIEKPHKRFRARPVDVRGVLPPPVGKGVRFAVLFTGIHIACGLEKGELLDGPLLDRNIGESLSQRFGGLLRAQEGRDNEKGRLALESLSELSGLHAAKIR
jgi:hypothetical protein